MNAKSILWLLSVVLLAGLAVLYMTYQKQAAELAQRRVESQELQQLRATTEEANKVQAQNENEELTRLRKENEDLLRLRSVVRQLRDEKQQLGKQVQSAEAQAQAAQTQAQNAQKQASALRDSAAAAAAQAGTLRVSNAVAGQPMTPEQQAFAARYGLAPTAPVTDTDKLNVCVNNLRQIDGAKQQWALENKKSPGAFMTPQDLTPYLRTMPTCPAGGVYTLNLVSTPPVCSVPGHALPR
jgi:myosin heavy subunit